MFAYLNLCKRDASVIKAIAENSIVQYVYVSPQYVYFFNDGRINSIIYYIVPFLSPWCKIRYCDALNDISITIAQELFSFVIASRIEQKVRALLCRHFCTSCRCVTIKRQDTNIYITLLIDIIKYASSSWIFRNSQTFFNHMFRNEFTCKTLRQD